MKTTLDESLQEAIEESSNGRTRYFVIRYHDEMSERGRKICGCRQCAADPKKQR